MSAITRKRMIRFSPLLLLPIGLLLRLLLKTSLFANFPVRGVSWTPNGGKWAHPVKAFDDSLLRAIGSSHNSHYDDFNKTLDSILIPRVPGTEGHEVVRQYILREMNAMGWKVEQDVFSDRTPHGTKEFANIIATHDPTACRNLVIACHYDSLHNDEFVFLGATDSAVPCAMMIHTARLLNPWLKNSSLINKDVTLQFIFFDGEEAFKRWSRTDSLYGSRHLAEKWNKRKPFQEEARCADREYASYLDRMEVMVLLDLIGMAQPKFFSYFVDTYDLHSKFVNVEEELFRLKLLHPGRTRGKGRYFEASSTYSHVQDDHVPFMVRGVPILHLIPSPFPSVWHKESDDRTCLHHPTINDLNKILRVFIAQYLHLNIPGDAPLRL